MKAAGLISFTAALQASAFLLPPNVAQVSDDKHAIGYGLTGPISPTSAVVQLPCSECAFSDSKTAEKIEQNEDEPVFWIQGGANSLLLNIAVSEDGRRLQVNGETIYPVDLLEADIFGSKKTYVNQVRAGASLADVEQGTEQTTPLEVTGHSVSVRRQEEDMIFTIGYQIYEVERQPVNLDSVSLTVLELPDGLAILEVASERPEKQSFIDIFGPAPGKLPHGLSSSVPIPAFEEFDMDMPERECHMLPAALCKLRNRIEDKIMGTGRKGDCHGRKGGRPFGGKLPTHIRPHLGFEDEHEHPHGGDFSESEREDQEAPHHRPLHGHGRPHHMGPHGRHGHHRHHFMHAFTRGLAAVLIPTMAGIAVGMSVSLIGLIFGRLIGYLWIKLYRGGRRGYASVSLDEALADDMNAEKEAVDEEPLPVYESAPAYDDIITEPK